MPFLIPTVDISPYLRDPSSSAAKDVVATIRSACLTTGFFQITGHGIEPDVQQGILEAAENLYNLPMDEKKKLHMSKNIGSRGYSTVGEQGYDKELLGDLKESFLLGHDHPLSSPLVHARRFFMGPNPYPPLPVSQFKEPVLAYFNAITQLTLQILEIIARTLPYGPHIFDNFIKAPTITPLRLLHYPPQTPAQVKRQLGASAHTDFGAITLLLQDKEKGLEVWDRESERWFAVEPEEGAMVVNIGDMLSMWTGGRYKSSLHRVVNLGGKERYSVAFFFDGNADFKLGKMEEDGKVGADGLTCEQYMIKRMGETFGKADKELKIKSKL